LHRSGVCLHTWRAGRFSYPSQLGGILRLADFFLSMVAPMIKSTTHMVAAFVSIITSLAVAGLPAGSGLLIAAVCVMATGVIVETVLEQKA
jgi:predicted branched-subunit amino acid permease